MTLCHEVGSRDEPASALAAPSRGNYLSPDPAQHPPEWLSPFGVGFHTQHDTGDGPGAHGWVNWLTLRRDDPKPKRKKRKRVPAPVLFDA